ncbi:MAG: pilus assembly protein CpaE [Moraxellaceae bacterium]|jgi:pilus assembly protein CpaE|nr:pilus assembly protein CpaE [Moraxellaceae bacterium]
MHSKLHILAAPASTDTANALRQCLGGASDFMTTLLTTGSTPDLDDGPAPDVVLYELPALAGDDLPVLQALLARLDAGTPVFVIGQVASPSLMRILMQMGVRDVLREPLEPSELLAALAGVQDERRLAATPVARCATVIALCNGHGSSGASLLAVNVGAALARRHGARVALIDFDLQFGKLAHYLDLKPKTHVLDALRDAHRLDPVFLKALMCEHEAGVQVLAAPPGLSPMEASAAAVRKLVDTAAMEHDVVLLDLPRVMNDWTLEALAASDRLLLVTQNTLGALRDTRRLMNYLTTSGEVPAERIEVVSNRAMSRLGSTTVDQMKRALGITRMHRIRNDYAAALAAGDQGLPLWRAAPQSVLGEDCERLALHLWRQRHPEAAAPRRRAPRWLDRLRGLEPQPTPAS